LQIIHSITNRFQMPSGLIRIYLFLIFLPFLSYSQDVQWASKVLGFSSENVDVNNQGPEYRAIQILGKPNVLPRQEKSKCAWSPTSDDGYGEEWIKVGYETPIHVSNIVICENIGAGAIIRVMLYDEQGKEYIVKEDTSDPPKEVGRVWNVQIPLTDYKVTALKLLLAPSKSKGINQIDAVGISNNAKPYEAKVNISSNMPKEILKENLGKAINSKGREVAPIITPDGRTLFFTREGHEGNIGKQKKQDVWVANTLSGGIWGDALNIAEPINSDVDNAVTTISADGKTVYILNIYLPNGTYLPGLSKSKKSKGGWEYPREVKITDYYNQSKFTEFSISSDGKTMIMACKRKDTKGGKDFYVSFLNANSTWTKPVNMVGLNTAEDESTPFIAADSKTLYFSTRGYPGFGDNDIFLSRRLDSTWTNWSEPENLGNLINTARWDGYFTIPASGEFAYLSSEEKSMGAEDIFRIKMFPSIKPDPVAIISGTAFNVMDKKPIAADVVLEVLSDSSTVTDKSIAEYDPETGEYKVVLPLKKMYALTATKKGFLSVSETVDLTKEKSFREIKKNIGMFPIKEGTKVILNNLFFNQSKFDILPSSYSELTRLVEVMLEYPRMEVLIEGHTDGNDDLNLNIKLSENRANEVKKFLVEKGGIEANRIQTKGWGPTKPISSNVTEETRKKNRRVEFSILKL
jgi:outer membrane protein OmpA-like peptidoglycan-associated protein